MNDTHKQLAARSPRHDGIWFAAATALALVVALGMRYGTRVLDVPATFDEPYIAAPIIDILQQGWSVRTAIDFEETKGPGLIWLYAIAGEAVGAKLNDLRLVSLVLFVLGVVPLLAIARRCGMHGASLVAVAGLYAALPYHAVLGQLVMSEPAFVLQMLVACWVFLWGLFQSSDRGAGEREETNRLEAASRPPRRSMVWALMLFTIALSILLHNRVHGVALAAAVCLVASQRGGIRGALPWVMACGIAGASRLPLWAHWGGLVSPRYQGIHSLGARFDGQTYLLASYAPLLAAFLIPAAIRRELRPRCWMIVVGAFAGLALAVMAAPGLSQTDAFEGRELMHYGGIVATAVRSVSSSATWQALLIGILAMFGGAGLGALASIAGSHPRHSMQGMVDRLQFWILAAGLAMYAASAAPVYDRYALGWAILLPIVWLVHLPRWLTIVQGLMLLGIATVLTSRWLL